MIVIDKDEDEHKENIKNKLEKNLSDPNVNEEINSTHKKFLSDFLSWLWTFISYFDVKLEESVMKNILEYHNLTKTTRP